MKVLLKLFFIQTLCFCAFLGILSASPHSHSSLKKPENYKSQSPQPLKLDIPQSLQQNGIPLLPPREFHNDEKIDVVYTWVDGSDPKWQAALTEYAEKDGGSAAAGALANRRFKDHDELRYSLRSILSYAPWVNHIYIVTFGQKPRWLKESPMITVVDHADIFKNLDDLPTFNSMAIECNLHRIPDLQEHFLYFNDDVFLGSNTQPKDFFTEDDKMRIFLSTREVPSGIPLPGEEGFFAASKNTTTLLDALFGPQTRYMHAHTPYPIVKSFVKNVETYFQEIFDKVSSHRFRSLEDYTITNGLIPYTALYMNQGEQSPDLWTPYTIGIDPLHDVKMFQKIERENPKFFCLQDGSDEENKECLSSLHCFLKSYFPHPAPWESLE